MKIVIATRNWKYVLVVKRFPKRFIGLGRGQHIGVAYFLTLVPMDR